VRAAQWSAVNERERGGETDLCACARTAVMTVSHVMFDVTRCRPLLRTRHTFADTATLSIITGRAKHDAYDKKKKRACTINDEGAAGCVYC